jgi:hypothetical protein
MSEIDRKSAGADVLRGLPLIEMMGFLDLSEILLRLCLINRRTYDTIRQENYSFFLKLLSTFNIPVSFERSDLAAREDIFEVFKRAMLASRSSDSVDLQPFAYFTDGGTYGNTSKYFLQNIWARSDKLYSSIDPKDVHVASTLQRVDFPEALLQPKKFIKKGTADKVLRIPFEEHVAEEASFKLPRELTVIAGGGSYTALVKSFLVCFSDVEMEPSRFTKLTKKFSGIASVDQLKELGLPLLQTWIEPETQTTVVEFDLSQRQRLKDALEVRTMLAHPLLLVILNCPHNLQKDVTYQIKQRAAAKFINMRLIKSTNETPSSNIDLYNLQLRGISLDFY